LEANRFKHTYRTYRIFKLGLLDLFNHLLPLAFLPLRAGLCLRPFFFQTSRMPLICQQVLQAASEALLS
jgi:hypothetical protein